MHEAFREGCKAYQDGLKIRDNPYSFTTFESFNNVLYEKWIDGWYNGADDD